jgi:hypothetical protein
VPSFVCEEIGRCQAINNVRDSALYFEDVITELDCGFIISVEILPDIRKFLKSVVGRID